MKSFTLVSTPFILLSSNFAYTSTAFVTPASQTTTIHEATHHSKSNQSFRPTHLVPRASPTVGRNGRFPPLFGKKKDTTLGKGGKIQVKLLKHIAGTGSAGEVIMVAPAFFQNKLQRSGSAVRISDDEVAKETAEKEQRDKEASDIATDLKEKIEGMSLSLSRKAGPDGQLFGGIGYKLILGELKKNFPKGALDAKYIKIASIKDEDDKNLKHDIKVVGEYTGTISLLKGGVSADFKISISAE
eukprot:CAMPEP_0197233722 /NCGR_PEP_ID=MMETSP1429-20130617/1717_1 /TAXON_ID=49237 /ORGANISM="Chaetoceros  sp., Strain UNC1202" /LENGTH=242 /DNA_ID=CAMNT_0042692027 /DNA_START=38 /DNA_END=766 /DNA_ORIENTATION=+